MGEGRAREGRGRGEEGRGRCEGGARAVGLWRADQPWPRLCEAEARDICAERAYLLLLGFPPLRLDLDSLLPLGQEGAVVAGVGVGHAVLGLHDLGADLRRGVGGLAAWTVVQTGVCVGWFSGG